MHCANLLIIIHSRVLQSSSIYICGCCLCPRFLKHPRIIFHDGTRIFKRFTYFYVYNMLCPLSSRIYVLFESSSRSDQSRRERKKLITMRTRSYIDSSTSTTTTHIIYLSRGNSLIRNIVHQCTIASLLLFSCSHIQWRN